ncbi:ead/Ea22-like family protein [Citrobacter amalonaticus]|uniref:ead/Ea22-like family protein n=1 Tax=Citrobacter amalonaticus TaxID=35703 RepID=UPI0028C099CF|nr:ead/Ea22-like family protein [Citrobacter amalonaticus]MDT7071047.1 ead/Ea22-like family protein [Citrobacter amalonaticus]
MSNIDKQALRKAAIAATGGKWVFSRSGANSNVQAPIELQKGGRALVVLCKLNNAGWSGQIQTENNAKFIAAASPETVLALLDELEASAKQNALDIQIKARLCRESNSLHDRLREAEKRIAELREWNLGLAQESFTYQQRVKGLNGIILSARQFISEYAESGDAGADEFVKVIDCAAGIGKGE